MVKREEIGNCEQQIVEHDPHHGTDEKQGPCAEKIVDATLKTQVKGGSTGCASENTSGCGDDDTRPERCSVLLEYQILH